MNLMMLWLLACGGDADKMEQTPRPDVPVAGTEAPPAADPVGLPDNAHNDMNGEGLSVPETARLGEAVGVTFSKMGANGCYRQTDVETEVNHGEKKVFHRYTTSSEGEMCTQALVPGGFKTEITLPERGAWTGTVLVDGTEAASYTLTIE